MCLVTLIMMIRTMLSWTVHFNRDNDCLLSCTKQKWHYAAEEVMCVVWLMSVPPDLMCFIGIWCRNGKHWVDADSMCVFFKKSIYCILLECIKNACDEGKSFRWIKSVKTSLWRQEALLHEQPPYYPWECMLKEETIR